MAGTPNHLTVIPNVTLTTRNISVSLSSNCTLNKSQNFALNGLWLIIFSVIVLCQTFNLFIFRLWPRKDPFLLYHIFLAVVTALLAVTAAGLPIARLNPWTPITIIIGRTSLSISIVCNRLNLIITLAISIDRWLSVEFPIWYRCFMSKRTVLTALVVCLLVALAVTVPIVVVPENLVVFCNRPFALKSELINATFVVLLFAFQVRILTIAVLTKLKLLRARRTRPLPVASLAGLEQHSTDSVRAERALIAHIVWEKLIASMVVVFVSVFANVIYFLEAVGLVSNLSPLDTSVKLYMTMVLYVYTPFVYLLFYPPFRQVVRELLPLNCRTSSGNDGPSVITNFSRNPRRQSIDVAVGARV
ncbi:hypothetical protein BV898_17460 [Hypsibius exemplaris]|uniref:G-protein coupled receptors family 1 profile domain-containing protein n=1 Tax=Hypsibius exemplaris TaxID=2072580 RepID=A0A9X6NGX0_HYPEX|nr:hypothetical protein BV898_17460 [Hypsibius exemplaris]